MATSINCSRRCGTGVYFVAAGALLLLIVLVVTAMVVKGRAQRMQYFQAASMRITGVCRDFVQDIWGERFDAAAARATPRFNEARVIKGESRELRDSPLASDEYVLIYKWSGSPGYTTWRVDARLTRQDGKLLFAQFQVVDDPNGGTTIFRWSIADWPAGHQLGNAIASNNGWPIEWTPWARDVSKGRH